MTRLRLVGRFALWFTLALTVLAAAWELAAPRYSAAVSAVAQPVFRAVEREDVTMLSTQKDELWIFRRVGEGRIGPFMFFDRYAFFALVPLIALFAATPGLRLGRRALRALCGSAVLFLVHVAYVVASVELSYAAAGLTAGGPHEATQWAVRLLWEAAPIVIWLALTAGAWIRALGAGPQAETGRIIAWTPREGRIE